MRALASDALNKKPLLAPRVVDAQLTTQLLEPLARQRVEQFSKRELSGSCDRVDELVTNAAIVDVQLVLIDDGD